MTVSGSCGKWRDLVAKHLGKQTARKWHEVMVNILSVDCGLKPALLVDFRLPEVSSLSDFIKAAQDTEMIKCGELKILGIGMDVLLINPFSLMVPSALSSGGHHKTEWVTSEVQRDKIIDTSTDFFHEHYFVDVSSDLDHPRSVPSVSCCLEQTRKCLERLFIELQSDSRIISMSLDCETENLPSGSDSKIISWSLDGKTEDLPNPPTLFGLLLNYPVVYWYSMSEDSQGTCLSMVPLKVYTVKASLKRDTPCEMDDCAQEHLIYSFSVPEALDSQVSDRVKSWFEARKSEEGWQHVFTDLRLETKTVQLPSVCL